MQAFLPESSDLLAASAGADVELTIGLGDSVVVVVVVGSELTGDSVVLRGAEVVGGSNFSVVVEV